MLHHTASLSWQIDLLASLLGNAVANKAGEDIFEIVDGLRLLCKEQEHQLEPDFDAVISTLKELDLSTIRWLLWVYLLFFNLVNQAEKQHIIRINQQRELEANADNPKPESIQAAIYQLKKNGMSLDCVLDLLKNIHISPTITAHPTETKRHSLLHKQVEVAELLADFDQELSSQQHDEKQLMLYELIVLMLYTDNIRHIRPTIHDEIHNGCYYLAGNIWQTIPELYHDLQYALKLYYNANVDDLPIVMQYRSWIGGDADGNPYVTPEVTQHTLNYQKQQAISNYSRQLEQLWDTLSISTVIHKSPRTLLQSLEEDRQTIAASLLQKANHEHELFREKINIMHAKLQHLDDYTSQQFLDDLICVQTALREINLPKVAEHSLLSDTISQVKTFGFHLAALDLRQHSDDHQQTLTEILQPTITDYSALNEDEKCELLNQLLSDSSTVEINKKHLTDVAQNCLGSFAVMTAQCQREPNAFGSYVISMTHSLSDILEVLLLSQLTGLAPHCDISPLFETVDDLADSHTIMQAAFANTHYQQHLQARNNHQEIMLGYSDSNKDGGYWTSNWSLHQAIRQLSQLCKDHRIDFCFFHGRGGSVGRGGGNLNDAIMASPSISHTGSIRFTEQGEVISNHYSLQELTHRHMEKVCHAMILTSADMYLKDYCDYWQQPKITELCDTLSDYARLQYRQLIDDPAFWPWFIETTPIEFISKLPIASRPVSRKSAHEVDFDGLRAIPWVFSWIQTRYNIPGWYGLGHALEAIRSEDDNALSLMQQCYQHWGFFREVINNACKELARAHISISLQYNKDDNSIHQKIRSDYALACKHIVAITQQDNLLDHLPVLQSSIQLRNPYTDVLNLLQIELMQRYRNSNVDTEQLLPLLLLSVNGISAAMQNAG